MNIDEIYSSNNKYLKHDDLKGAKPVVQIQGFTIETMKSSDGDKPQVVLSFVGKDKVLGLNKTNALIIAAHAGSKDPNDWIGAKIRLYQAITQFQGRETPCVRVSEEYYEPPVGKQPPASVEAVTADEIPF